MIRVHRYFNLCFWAFWVSLVSVLFPRQTCKIVQNTKVLTLDAHGTAKSQNWTIDERTGEREFVGVALNVHAGGETMGIHLALVYRRDERGDKDYRVFPPPNWDSLPRIGNNPAAIAKSGRLPPCFMVGEYTLRASEQVQKWEMIDKIPQSHCFIVTLTVTVTLGVILLQGQLVICKNPVALCSGEQVSGLFAHGQFHPSIFCDGAHA